MSKRLVYSNDYRRLLDVDPPPFLGERRPYIAELARPRLTDDAGGYSSSETAWHTAMSKPWKLTRIARLPKEIRMATAPLSISITKNKIHTLTFKQFDSATGTTLVPHGGTSLSSSDNFVATANFDPTNDRRVIIHGTNPGTCSVQVGSGPSPLTINVTVPEPPDLSHFELDVDEGEF